MPTAFPHTDQALRADSGRPWRWGLLAASILLAVWLTWAWRAPLAVYEVSTSARLEADRAVHVVEAPVSGRVRRTHLKLGREVRQGAVLVELEATSQTLRHREVQAHLVALNHRLDAFQAEIAGAERAQREAQHAAHASIAEARARVREAEVTAQYTAREAKRTRHMFERGFVSEAAWHRAYTEARQGQAALERLRLAVARQQRDDHTQQHDRQTALQRLRRERAEVEAERAVALAEIERMGHDIDHRRIATPVDGRLGDVTALQPGTFVNAGDPLAAVVPAGTLKLVADFAPAAALGRIRPGQTARLRLDGFPWTQYGAVTATVQEVASEAQNGRVRVELRLTDTPSASIPMQHGLTGEIEIEVERVTPAQLALRAIGLGLTAKSEPMLAELNAPDARGDHP